MTNQDEDEVEDELEALELEVCFSHKCILQGADINRLREEHWRTCQHQRCLMLLQRKLKCILMKRVQSYELRQGQKLENKLHERMQKHC